MIIQKQMTRIGPLLILVFLFALVPAIGQSQPIATPTITEDDQSAAGQTALQERVLAHDSTAPVAGVKVAVAHAQDGYLIYGGADQIRVGAPQSSASVYGQQDS